MSAFFTNPGSLKKRKRAPDMNAPKKRLATSIRKGVQAPKTLRTSRLPKPAPLSKTQADRDDESISGSDSDSESPAQDEIGELLSGSEDEGETAAEKRLRLAERYLQNIRQEVDAVGFDAEDVDRDIIAERLQEDAAESKGRVYRTIADEFAFHQASHTLFRSDTHSTTSVAICPPYAYTVSKDLCLIKWKLQNLPSHQFPQTTRKKPSRPSAPPRKQPERLRVVRGNRNKENDKHYQGHTKEILTVAASQDGKFVVTGGADRRLIVYDARTLTPVRVFTHHRDAITGLAFRRGTNQLYSSSKDRTIKVWSLDELAYIETLFGHQDEVLDVDALAQERCVTVGALDRTARLWKVVEETQLVFRGGPSEKKSRVGASSRTATLDGSMDRVAMVDDDLFVTGSDNGSIALWSLQKKKPLFILPLAHGEDPPVPVQEASAECHPDARITSRPQPRWITALRTLPYSDLIFSGSWDGYVRAWKLSEDKRAIQPVGVIGMSTKDTQQLHVDLAPSHAHADGNSDTSPDYQAPWAVKGVVNDISVFERGDRAKDGLCVVAAVGKEHRLGKWQKVKGGKNGAVVFEIPRVSLTMSNGDNRAHSITD